MFTLFLPLSQEPRLARIWLSIAVTHESLSSMLGASKCHVCPVNDTMMKSAFSSSAKRGWSRRNMTWDLLHSTNRENESIELSVGGGKINEKQNKTKQWFRFRHEDRKIFGLITLRDIQTNNGCRLWMSGTQGRKTVREHKLCQHHHPHLLPVLLMFLKLPKLFNFHILRLAAEQEISKRRERGVQVLGKKGRYEIFRERQTRLLIFIHTEEKERENKKSCAG